ncbi:hypothetical protein EJD97_017214, partial [Solanum chilense]
CLKSYCDSISNSMIMTCFCDESARCFTSRNPLNPGRRFYRCSKPKMENLRESLNKIKIERDNLKKKLENLEILNYFEVNK